MIGTDGICVRGMYGDGESYIYTTISSSHEPCTHLFSLFRMEQSLQGVPSNLQCSFLFHCVQSSLLSSSDNSSSKVSLLPTCDKMLLANTLESVEESRIAFCQSE